MGDLRWLVENGWTNILLTYWPADEDNNAKWLAKARKVYEIDDNGCEANLWHCGATPEQAIAGLVAQALGPRL